MKKQHKGAQAGDCFFNTVYELTCRVPKGCVTTYGQLARLAGRPLCARYVGYALHRNPRPGVIPCHRVVFKDGSLSSAFAFGGENAQRAMLTAEGVPFLEDGRVDMDKAKWRF